MIIFSNAQIATAGNDEVLRYTNQALKTQVEACVKKIKHHSFEQGK